MGCGVAGIAAAGISAAAGIGGALISSSASQNAAGQIAGASNQASQNAINENNQTVQNLSPFTNAGTNAVASLEDALGIGGWGPNPLTTKGLPGLTFLPTQQQLESTPGYQFDLTQGLQAVQNSNAATGNGISGNALKGAASYATGLANNTLTTQQGIFQQNLANVINPLTQIASQGENAAAQTGSLGNQAIGNANSLAVGGANAAASGTVGSANAISSGLNGLGNNALNYSLYNQLLGSGSGSGTQGYVDSGNFD